MTKLAFVKKEDWKALKIFNVKTEDFKNCPILKTEDLAIKPSKPENQRYAFLTGKIWLLSVINCEDGSWWYLPNYRLVTQMTCNGLIDM